MGMAAILIMSLGPFIQFSPSLPPSSRRFHIKCVFGWPGSFKEMYMYVVPRQRQTIPWDQNYQHKYSVNLVFFLQVFPH